MNTNKKSIDISKLTEEEFEKLLQAKDYYFEPMPIWLFVCLLAVAFLTACAVKESNLSASKPEVIENTYDSEIESLLAQMDLVLQFSHPHRIELQGYLDFGKWELAEKKLEIVDRYLNDYIAMAEVVIEKYQEHPDKQKKTLVKQIENSIQIILSKLKSFTKTLQDKRYPDGSRDW